MYDFQFATDPTTRREALRAAALATLDASLFAQVTTAEPQPHEVGDAGDAAEVAIEQGDHVSVFPPGAWEPRPGIVLAVRDDGLYLVQMLFGAKKWWFERDLTLVLKAEAAALCVEEAS